MFPPSDEDEEIFCGMTPPSREEVPCRGAGDGDVRFDCAPTRPRSLFRLGDVRPSDSLEDVDEVEEPDVAVDIRPASGGVAFCRMMEGLPGIVGVIGRARRMEDEEEGVRRGMMGRGAPAELALRGKESMIGEDMVKCWELSVAIIEAEWTPNVSIGPQPEAYKQWRTLSAETLEGPFAKIPQ